MNEKQIDEMNSRIPEMPLEELRRLYRLINRLELVKVVGVLTVRPYNANIDPEFNKTDRSDI